MATSINAVQWNMPYKQVPPSYNTQQNQLSKAGWSSMAGYGQSPDMYVPPVFPVSKAGAGRGGVSFLGGDTYNDALRASSRLGRQVPTPTTPPLPSTASAFPTTNADMTGFISPQQAVTYSPVSPNIYDPGNLFSNIPNTSFGGNVSTPVPPSGWFGDMMGKGKKFFEDNKWLTGDKETVGAIPLGLGLFNAFNQYTQGRESIKSMREQNALARESFALNKAGALASLEDQYNKRNSNDMYHRNPNLSYADNKSAASSKTLEDMKRFK